MNCKNCGAHLPEDAIFCTECGTKQGDIPTEVAPEPTEATPSTEDLSTEDNMAPSPVEDSAVTDTEALSPVVEESTSETVEEIIEPEEEIASDNIDEESPPVDDPTPDISPLSPPSVESASPAPSVFSSPLGSISNSAEAPVTPATTSPLGSISNTGGTMPHPTPTPNPQGAIPEGFALDPQSGLYYKSALKMDPQTGQQIQDVIYYDIQTNSYSQASYPLGGGVSSTPYKKQNKMPIIIAAIVSVVLLIAAVVAVAFSIKNAEPRASRDPESSIENRDESSTSSESTSRPAVSVDGLEPIFTAKADAYALNFPQNSSFHQYAKEDDKYLYFISFTDFSTPVDPDRFLYRYDKENDQLELFLDAGEGVSIFNFYLLKDEIVFCFTEMDSTGNSFSDQGHYYKMPIDGGDLEYMFTAEYGVINIVDGYIYIVSEIGDTLFQVGLDDKNYVINETGVDLVSQSSGYVGTSFAVVYNGDVYYSVIDSDDSSETFFRYNLAKDTVIEIFRGSPNFFYYDMFIDGDNVYYVKYDIESSGYDLTVATSVLGEANSEKVIYRYKSSEFPNYGVFIGKHGDDIIYETKTELAVAPLSNTEKSATLFDKIRSPYAISPNWIVQENGMIEIETGEFISLKVPSTSSALNKLDLSDAVSGSPSRNSSSSSSGPYTSPDGKEFDDIEEYREYLYQYYRDNVDETITRSEFDEMFDGIFLDNSSSNSSGSDSYDPFSYSSKGDIFNKGNFEKVLVSFAQILPYLENETSWAGGPGYNKETMYLAAGAWLQDPMMKSMFVDKDNKIDVGYLKAAMYDLTLTDDTVFETYADKGDIEGIYEKNGDYYLDPTWKPKKEIDTVTVVSNEESNEQLGGSTDYTAVLKIKYKDGTTITYVVEYYGNIYKIISDFAVLYLYDK